MCSPCLPCAITPTCWAHAVLYPFKALFPFMLFLQDAVLVHLFGEASLSPQWSPPLCAAIAIPPAITQYRLCLLMSASQFTGKLGHHLAFFLSVIFMWTRHKRYLTILGSNKEPPNTIKADLKTLQVTLVWILGNSVFWQEVCLKEMSLPSDNNPVIWPGESHLHVSEEVRQKHSQSMWGCVLGMVWFHVR